MGIFFTLFMGKSETDLKEMRDVRINKLVEAKDVAKVESLVSEIEAIDSELAKIYAKDESK